MPDSMAEMVQTSLIVLRQNMLFSHIILNTLHAMYSLETSAFEELGSEFINFASNCVINNRDCLFNWAQHLNLEITLL